MNVFGTNYNPAQDLARIPLTRRNGVAPEERLALTIADGVFAIRWADVAWTVPIGVKN